MKYAAAGTGSKVATWTFTVTPGLYQVAATWVAQSNRATNSPFTVADGTTALGTVAVNQQLAPTDFTDQGVGWKTLGSFTISGNTLVVTLTNAANQYVVADAIRIQKIANQPVAAVFDGTTAVPNGGSDSFGTTPPGRARDKNFHSQKHWHAGADPHGPYPGTSWLHTGIGLRLDNLGGGGLDNIQRTTDGCGSW